MSDPAVHIAAWEAEGVIDAGLAARLRAAAASSMGAPPVGGATADAASVGPVDVGPARTTATFGSFFGPSVTIGEMFGYLGVAFLLGAWTAFLARIAGTTDRDAILTGGTLLAAIVTAGLGVVLMAGDARRRRAAGVAFLASTVLVAGTGAFLVQLLSLQGPSTGILVAGLTLVAAIIFRFRLAAVTTQVGLIGALIGLAAAIMGWLQAVIVGECCGGGYTLQPEFPPAEPVTFVLLSAGLWLLVALGLGLLGLVEARAARTDAPAARRAAITRFAAGFVGVVGLASTLTHSGSLGAGDYGRILAPWLGELVILGFSIILVERAFRRDANAFIVSAAIGLIVALTDFNFSYLSDSTDVGLLIEGAILLAVGFGADRLRRRLARSGAAGSGRDDREEPAAGPA